MLFLFLGDFLIGEKSVEGLWFVTGKVVYVNKFILIFVWGKIFIGKRSSFIVFCILFYWFI